MNFNFKFILLFLLCLYALISLVFFNFYKSIAIKDARQQAEYALNNMLEIRMYINNVQRPAINELLSEDERINSVDFKILSSNYLINTIYKNNLLKNNLSFEYRLASINPLNPWYKATPFEEKILLEFRDDRRKKIFTDIIEENGNSYYFMAKPIERNTKSCLQCHGNPKDVPKGLIEQYGSTSGFNEEIGDLSAMLYVKMSIKNIMQAHKAELIWGGAAMFLAFIVIIILIYLLIRQQKNLQSKKEYLYSHQNRLAIMGNMIGNISHQLKQPLTHISNIFINLELQIELKKLTNEKVQNKIIDATEQIEFISTTIDDFKNFFTPKDVVNTILIEEIILKSQSLLSASLLNTKIKLQIDIRDNFLVYAQKNEIIQIIINIIQNAKDAFIINNISNRTIKISAFTKKNQNIITIENNGGNIDEVNMQDVFKPYFTTKNKEEGTGIGLYMSKTIMEKYNGFINVKNSQNGVIFSLIFNKTNKNN